MKKPGVLLILILVTFTILPLTTSEGLPNYYDKYVNDFAGMFNENETAVLRTLFYETDINTTAEVVLATITECAQDSSVYAFNLASTWKVGKADKDNGLLILYCQKENKISVQTGYGLEGILPDSKLGRMLDDYYVPLRDENKTKEGIILFSKEVVNVIEENRDEVLSGQASGYQKGNFIVTIIWIFIAYIIISRIMRIVFRNRKNKKKTNMPWFMPIFIPFPSGNSSGGSGGGFSGGGFGGGGFGGGGFGGGGASR